jgi:SSS family transporter
MDRNSIILTCVAAYMVACVAIGIWAMRRTKTTRDFFMAGRNLGVALTGIAMFSSIMSGFGFVGGPGLVYRMGLSSFWILVSTPIGFCLAFFLLAKRMRLLAEVRDSQSLPDIVAARFGSEAVRFWSALAILFGVVAYLAAQIKAMATVLQDILQRNNLVDSDSFVLCVFISCTVLVFYCVAGGIIASVYTDLFQGLVMLVAAVLIFITAARAVEGGFAEMSQTIMSDDSEAIRPWGTLGIIGCLSWHFLFALGVVGQPHVVTKLMMSRDVRDARFTLPITLAGYTIAALLWISIGLLMRTLVLQGQHAELARPDHAAAQFLQHYAHPLLAGLVFAGLFAAIMSTADGFLNIGAAAIVHDIPRALRGKSLVRELLWARIATAVLAIGAAVFALYSPQELIGQLGAFGWGVFASAMVPVVGYGLNWKRATPLAACVSIIASFVINAAVVIVQLLGVGIPYGIAGGALSLIASLTLFVGISLISKPKKIDRDVEAIMDL